MKTEVITLNKERNVTLTAYIQDVRGEFDFVTKRPAILVLPGGAYRNCSDREADPVALAYLKAGYQAFVLRYSLNEQADWPNPLEDYEQAMSLIRENKDQWNLYEDKIAVIGFSAGGHLASAAATMSKNRPNAAILGYAGTLDDMKTLNATHPNTTEAVNKDTCPCFLFATSNDKVVPILNTVKFTEALAKEGILFESHIYSFGPHGFSIGDSSIQSKSQPACGRISNWVEDSIGWLKEVFGDFSDDGLSEPTYKKFMNDNHKEFLSVDCTMEYLMTVPEAKEILDAMMKQVASNSGMEEKQEKAGEGVAQLAGKMTLRDCFGYVRVPKEVIDGLNEKLKQIKNPLD